MFANETFSKLISKVMGFLTATLLVSLAVAGGKAHWGYVGHAGPEHWGELDEAFKLCANGKNQSPIDLSGFVEATLSPIKFEYATHATEILNNGHTVQANYAPGSTLSLGGHVFELKQFHFHAPSENHVEGRSFPMEAHFVHADAQGNLAVVAVLFEEGLSNQSIESLWKLMPEDAGDNKPLPKRVSALGLLPSDKSYYRFNGSLTTPPCTEGVWWLVMKQTMSASRDEIERFARAIHHPNNRPLQAANARPVLQ